MKLSKLAALTVALFAGIAAATHADANGRRHHHRGGHVGIYFGAPLFPYYAYPYYPRYYYPPTVVVPAPMSPPVYIEQAPSSTLSTPQAQSSAAHWYYCPDSQTYYPYVQRCAVPWQQVIPQPPGPPS
jgi:hypothetical protein